MDNQTEQAGNQQPLAKQQKSQLQANIGGHQFSQKKEETDEEAIFLRICQYLRSKNIEFKSVEHEPTRTSEESAIVRKTPLEWGSKTMLVTAGDGSLVLLIYRAHNKVSWKKIRKVKELGKKAQMATEEQVLKLGVKPGGVPPFPNMIGLKGVLDAKFKQIQMMAFNAGHRCKSIIMKTADYPLESISIQDFTQQ